MRDEPLTALLSKVLVAYTVEADSEFEARLAERGHREQLSLVTWWNFLQHLAPQDTAMGDVAALARLPFRYVGSMAACMERWGFVTVTLRPGGTPRAALRDGWGAATGLRASSVVEPTPKGLPAIGLFPDVIHKVEQRWGGRFGAALSAVRTAVTALADEADVAMPDFVPGLGGRDPSLLSSGRRDGVAGRELVVQLSMALLALALAFDEQSRLPLELSSNTLRVLTEDGVEPRELPLLSGLSRQATGAQCTVLQKFGLAVREPIRGTRRKVMRATPAGLSAQRDYRRISDEIEREPTRLEACTRSRRALMALLEATRNGEPLIREALVPPPNVRRSGADAPALGRVDVAAAARTRNRELLAQTEAYLADPIGGLAHYPVWDANRGFGI